jgi:acetolactate synthase regulatory subunit
MAIKLTLSIKEETIERAKRISKKRGKSISKMVEEYFDNISEQENNVNPLEAILQVTRKHKSKIELPVDGDYDRAVNDMRYQDYIEKVSKI